MQTFGVLSEILEKHPSLSYGLIMGGANRQAEAQKLAKGISFLVATPGRLLDHLQVIVSRSYSSFFCFLPVTQANLMSFDASSQITVTA